MDDLNFGGLLRSKIVAAGIAVLLHRIAPLLGHLVEHCEHLGIVKPQVQGRADLGKVSGLVKQQLG